MNTNIKYSAQAFIFGPDGKILLEDNAKIKGKSLVGGACKDGESYENCLWREIGEELGEEVKSILEPFRWINKNEQPKRRFLTGEWISCYFTIILSGEEQKMIPSHTQDGHHNSLGFYSFKDLETFDTFSLEKALFLKLIREALKDIGN